MNQPQATIYWEGGRPPAYITLCVTTWLKYLQFDGLVALNQQNAKRYLGDRFEVGDLRRIGLAQQSDLVSAVYLAKFGGTFVDADTIFTNKKCVKLLQAPTTDELRLFGYHIGFLSSPEQGTAVSHWAKNAVRKLGQKLPPKSWSDYGNAIIDPFGDQDSNRNFLRRMSIPDAEVTPELKPSFWGEATKEKDRARLYQRFWFGEPEEKLELLSKLEASKSGVVCLHNSWTPGKTKLMSKDQILNSNTRLGLALANFADVSMFDAVEELLAYGS